MVLFTETPIRGAFVVEPEPRADERGLFARTWCRQELADRGFLGRVAQCGVSFSPRRGTLRGLHYQTEPHGEEKLVRVTRGAAYDVIVDLRGNSATFGRWFAVELTCDNRWALAIPSGCAHGLLTLADDTEVFYQMSAPYCPAAARGVRWDDPAIGIDWPEAVQVISERDRSWPLLALGPRAEFSTSAAGQEACA